MYRHPAANIQNFQDEFCRTISTLAASKKEYLICGDFNIDLLKYESVNSVTDNMNFLYSEGCYNLIDKPTRITSTSSTLLAHIYTNISDKTLTSGILTYDVSDHLPIYCSLTQSPPDRAGEIISEIDTEMVNISEHLRC